MSTRSRARSLGVWIAGSILAAIGGPAHAAPLPFNATLTLDFGPYFGSVSASGSGVGASSGVGGAASIPAGAIPLQVTQPLPAPILFLLYGLAVAAPGQIGASAPFAPGASRTLAWNGSTGTMELDASAYLLGKSGGAAGSGGIPLDLVGVGGTRTFTAAGNIPFTLRANPYQLGMATISGLLNNLPFTLVATGMDDRTIGGAGTLQLVSPTAIT